MAKPLISEVLKECGKLKTKKERVDFLRKNNHPAIRDVLRVNFDDDIVSLLPEGTPPYQKDDAPKGHEYLTLYKGHRRFKYFFKGPTALAQKAIRRESMFISLLESLHAEDAEMLCLAKDKKLKITGITKKLVSDAFPNLIVK